MVNDLPLDEGPIHIPIDSGTLKLVKEWIDPGPLAYGPEWRRQQMSAKVAIIWVWRTIFEFRVRVLLTHICLLGGELSGIQGLVE